MKYLAIILAYNICKFLGSDDTTVLGSEALSTSVATYDMPGTAVLPGTFTPALNDKESDEFKQIEFDFCSQVGTYLEILLKHIWVSVNSHSTDYTIRQTNQCSSKWIYVNVH